MFARRVVSLCLGMLSSLCLCAQHNPYEYYLGGASSQYLQSGGYEPDLTLFYSPLGGSDIFTELSEFNFSAVRYARRGYDLPLGKSYLGNIDLSNPQTLYADYALLSVIRRSRLPRSIAGGLGAEGADAGVVSISESFVPDPDAVSQGYRFGTFAYSRNGRLGATLSGADRIGGSADRGLSFAYNLYLRGGKDAIIDGVFTEEFSLALIPKYRFGPDTDLTAGLFAGRSKRGLRSSATKEAFDLSGDNFYNPSWGYFDGKVRNSRVRGERPVMAFAALRHTASWGELDFSASYVGNKRSYGSLSWFDAATPYPDYYRDMPSWLGDTPAGDYLREQWLHGNASVTQIDWARLCETNFYAGQRPVEEGGARYFMEERIERSDNYQLAVSGRTSTGIYSSITYGVRARNDGTHYYKQVGDLLGGTPFLDADQYLADTTRYGGRWLNDLQNPDRKVGEGDVFGYSYRFLSQRYELFGSYDYMKGRFRFNAAVEAAANRVRRKGVFEKELHPGDASLGESDAIEISSYAAKISFGYSFSPKHIVRLSGVVGNKMPVAANLFIAPEHSNMQVGEARAIAVQSAEAQYMATLGSFICKLTGLYTGTGHETAVYSYYDDIEGVYSDMVLSGISKRFYGVELGARYDFSPRLSLSVAASAGDFTYTTDPSVDIYEDATLEKYVERSRSYLKGYRVGNTPQRAVSAELEYNMYGFIASLTLNYMADRYVVANPLRRMERAYNLAGSPERFDQFVAQEKLPDAATVDLFILKSFDLGKGAVTLLFSVNNLLGKRDIIYSGYEQMRIMRRGTGINRRYVPFDSKYLYSYPRSFYLSATYRF